MNLFPNTYLGPHWNALDSYMAGLSDFFVASVPLGCSLLALDESTAVVGDGQSWVVTGQGQAHSLAKDSWRHFEAGDRFELPML